MEGKIVFIDGVCVLCDGLADYILKHDSKKSIAIAALQGETAKDILPENLINDLQTFVYFRESELLTKSSAIIKLFSDLGGWRKVVSVFLIIPKSIRDWAYLKLASKRYKWFGKLDTCRLPEKSEVGRILN